MFVVVFYLNNSFLTPMDPDNKLDNKEDDSIVEIDPDQLEFELGVPKTLRTEYNFIKFPFFDLTKNSRRDEIRIEETIQTEEGEMAILWSVTRDVKSQFPGDFEKRLHRAVEQIINVMPKPIHNPLRIGSLRYIAKLMGINPESGKNRSNIQKALQNLVTASITTQGTFQLKENKSKRFLKDTFHLYDRVIYKGEELPEGGVADCIYIMLGSWYLSNVNNNYVIPIDWGFYNRLQGTRTTRMYEFFSIYFFVALENRLNYYDIRYSKICDYFPLVRYHKYGEARRQLKGSHESLLRCKYLSEVEWLDTHEKDDWIIRYWIGERARDEYERNKKEIRRLGEHRITIPPRRRRERLKKSLEKPTDVSDLEKNLIERGITTPKVLQKLLENHSEGYLAQKIEVFDFLVEIGSKLVGENPAGFLRMSIEDDYGDPPNFISKEERARRAKIVEGNERYRKWLDRVEEYKYHLETPPEKLVYGDLWLWENRHKKEQGQPPTQEEKAAKEQELIEQLPEKDELQKQIFSKVMFKAKTVNELEGELKNLTKEQILSEA